VYGVFGRPGMASGKFDLNLKLDGESDSELEQLEE
jgi:hypothetical protein